MAVVCLSFLFLLLAGEGFSQCYSDTACSGSLVPAANQRECCAGTDEGLAYSAGGTCNLCIVHGFAQAVYDVDEDARLDTEFRLNVKGMTALPGLVIRGTITAEAAGTATYMGNLPIGVSVTRALPSAEIRLFTANDEATLEYDDRVRLDFNPTTAGLITGLEAVGEYVRNTAFVNIIDDDLLQINFDESDYSIYEGSSVLSSQMSLRFRANQNPFSVTLTPVTIDIAENMSLGDFIYSNTIGPTFRAKGDDFTNKPLTITIPANRRSYTIEQFFNISDDNIDEDQQSFAIVAEIGPDVPH